ncbi:putative transcriptional regulator [Yersinia frederiksenii]|uniref:Type II toxin-antitoxin system HipA family toxin n=1 Tax=Yersinia alsatica TaxID=2890317 RepID=A0ABY5UPE8_9GAMM|nr:type II toxin-antitoxin system HipA family toxin [Yersinia alsatica]OWF67703.1 phosphatidylinositol kinase [Yersinia frederiksenii]UWM45343.1 type II toxin-antitoxin system HipA family toxin [Yersinia alsatica]CFQ63788.1 putative transcriptional regulator [Yersinia frederiksenii]CNI01025.1 putative transcriptional regulator [Yersinia frederiksenii]CNI59877.1 putative transcriptional regulator [Yersinia frederiksenii]
MAQQVEQVEGLALYLGDIRIGVLVHYTGGRNALSFDPDYIAMPEIRRPIFTLTQQVDPDYLRKVQINKQRLPPVLSNLLPEGALRKMMTTQLKTHEDNEFPLLARAGENLAGALVARPLLRGSIPQWALSAHNKIEAVQIDIKNIADKFSLAGIQMKFSSRYQDGRYLITTEVGEDDWIVKTPSTVHKNVPENEYSVMRLAQAIGIEIPEINLVSLDEIDNLPDIQLPTGEHAYLIRRFDRSAKGTGRIHTEDFAQIFNLYPSKKYADKNYEQIAAVLYNDAGGLADLQQMARRLLGNILLANGDAHLKNWTVTYPDGRHAKLSPAYDIVCTKVYMTNESELALRMAKEKQWYLINFSTFKKWCERIDAPYLAIKAHLDDAMEIARQTWPDMLALLPMNEAHKKILRAHWLQLHTDFRL